MDNHVHLLIQTSTQALGPLMKKINMNYAIYFNKKYNYIGYLHQDRFHADLIENSSHLLTVSRYIHLNPVVANMVEFPEEYSHSSYRSFIAMDTCEIVSKERVLSHFPEDRAPRLYQEFVESKIIQQREGNLQYVLLVWLIRLLKKLGKGYDCKTNPDDTSYYVRGGGSCHH